jgi:hypothetical protein
MGELDGLFNAQFGNWTDSLHNICRIYLLHNLVIISLIRSDLGCNCACHKYGDGHLCSKCNEQKWMQLRRYFGHSRNLRIGQMSTIGIMKVKRKTK